MVELRTHPQPKGRDRTSLHLRMRAPVPYPTISGGAAGNVAYGGTVNPPRNRKGGAGNPPPKGARASALPDIPILRCRSSTRRRHCIATCGCAASTAGSTAPATGGSSTQCSTSMRCRARVGFQWPSASASKRKHLPRPGASTRRSSRQSTTLSIAVSTGCAPTAPMGLHTPSHCRYWPPTCTASVCLCDGACVRPNDVEDAALPERGHLLRTSPAPLGAPRRERPSVPGSRECGPV